MYRLYNQNCLPIISDIVRESKNPVIVSDPPFNIGYHYNTYKDKMAEEEYLSMISEVFGLCPAVIIHYPESIHKLSIKMCKSPVRVVSWVYNSNTAKQHRDIAFYDIEPNFEAMRQPYKNLNDKRIQQRIKDGCIGGRLYDWWEINQVKNVSKDKMAHPCQMPLTVMENIIGVLPKDITVIDPFMGSGTTGIACQEKGVDFVGVEIDSDYFIMAKERMENESIENLFLGENCYGWA